MTEQSDSLREKLAAIEHERWSHWQKWMHSKGEVHVFNGIGYLCFSQGYIDHLNQQIATPYAELSETEKQSDRDQVMRYWPIVEKMLLAARAELSGIYTQEEMEQGQQAPEPVQAEVVEQMATEQQVKKMFAALRGKGVKDSATAKQIIYELGNVDSVTKLTYAQASDVINKIDAADEEALVAFYPAQEEAA